MGVVLFVLQLKVYRGQKSSLYMYRVSTSDGQAVPCGLVSVYGRMKGLDELVYVTGSMKVKTCREQVAGDTNNE